MRCLSLTQPWAWCMMHGPKRVENRTKPADYMVGQTFAMHASMKWDKDGERYILGQEILVPPRGTLVHGAIIGVTTMVRCVSYEAYDLMDEARQRELIPEDQEDWFFGPFGYLLTNMRPITPIPYPGSLGFFGLRDDIVREIERRLNEPADTLPAPALPQQVMPWEPPGGLHRAPRRSSNRGRR